MTGNDERRAEGGFWLLLGILVSHNYLWVFIRSVANWSLGGDSTLLEALKPVEAMMRLMNSLGEIDVAFGFFCRI